MEEGVQKKPKRILSVDVLRGFDMFFIIGGADLIGRSLCALGAGGCWLEKQTPTPVGVGRLSSFWYISIKINRLDMR